MLRRVVLGGSNNNGFIGNRMSSNISRYYNYLQRHKQQQQQQQHYYYYSSSGVVRNSSSRSSSRGTDDDELIVSILGPPNAGKSTLFNRLMDKGRSRAYILSSDKKSRRIKRKHYSRNTNWNSSSSFLMGSGSAIVSPTPGTTRDRKECWGRIGETTFRLVDTAGIDGEQISSKDSLQQQMLHQTWEAARQADLILLIMDAQTGYLTTDYMDTTAAWLRRVRSRSEREETLIPQTVLLVANKLEGDAWDYDESPVRDTITEASRLGFGDPIIISAIHGDGMSDLALAIEKSTKEKQMALGSTFKLSPTDDNDDASVTVLEDEEETNNDDNSETEEKKEQQETNRESPLVKIAILGRVNVGKSTLVNSLLGVERVISGPTPGLTRDSISTDWQFDGTDIQLVDTAGIRKSCQEEEEEWAVQDAFRAMKVADVAVLVLDAGATKLQKHEMAIADAVVKEGRALVVVANKQDLLVTESYSSKDYAEAVRDHLENRLPMLRNTPIVPLSSLYQKPELIQNLLMPVIVNARQRWARTISTGILNRWLKEVIFGHAPPRARGRPTKLKYILQTKGRPPTFLVYANQPDLPQNYVRYLTRNFQDTFEYFGMEIRLIIKFDKKDNPFYAKSLKEEKRSGFGIGGGEARKERRIHQLKTTGRVQKGHKRKPRQQDKKKSRNRKHYQH